MKKALAHISVAPAVREPITLRVRLVSGLTLLGLFAGLGLFASRPAHTVGGPVPVTVANTSLAVTDADAARQAVSGTLILTDSAYSGTLFTIPSDKRLVMETVSIIGNRFDANTYTIEMDTTQGGAFRQICLNLLPNGAPSPALIQPLRLYGDPGTQVKVFASSDGREAKYVGVSFFGHLVNL